MFLSLFYQIDQSSVLAENVSSLALFESAGNGQYI